MKVLFISPNSPFESIGGVERYVINLINYFKVQKDIKTFLVLPTTGKSHHVDDGNMSIYYDNNLSIPRAKLSAKDMTAKAEGFSKLIEKIVKENGIEVICAENIIFSTPPSYSIRLNMIAINYNIPIMLRLHMYPESPLQIALTKELMWDRISCVSTSVAGDCFQKGTDVNKLSTDYLGVNTNDFRPKGDSLSNFKKELGFDEDIKIVLTAGRIITGTKNMLKEKGMINLVEAFARVAPNMPNARLLIGVGRASVNLKAEFEDSLQMLMGYIKINGIKDKTVVKMFELDQMPDVYRSSDVLVLPAEKNETLGQIFIEAMACGLPVIGAKTGGMPEIIDDGYSGYLVHPNDPIILAQKIETILTDKDLRNYFINNGFRTVEAKFTAAKRFPDFHKLLKSLIN